MSDCADTTIQQLMIALKLDIKTARAVYVILVVPEDGKLLSVEAQWLADYREDCRQRKDFKTSDELRDILTKSGYRIKDSTIK